MNFEETIQKYEQKYSCLATTIPELIALKTDLKKSILITLHDDEDVDDKYRKIRKFCKDTELVLKTYFREDELKLSISKQDLKIPEQEEEQNIDNRFSYPECCIKKYTNRKEKGHAILWLRETILKETNENIDFRMNPFLTNTPFHLYIHTPCSLRCEKTLSYAKNLLRIIKNKNFRLYEDIMRFSKGPVFYTDICMTPILFEGSYEKGEIRYKNIYYPPSWNKNLKLFNNNTQEDIILLETIMTKLKKGDKMQVQDNNIIIKKEYKEILKIKKPEHLRWKMMIFI